MMVAWPLVAVTRGQTNSLRFTMPIMRKGPQLQIAGTFTEDIVADSVHMNAYLKGAFLALYVRTASQNLGSYFGGGS